jgi:hypothetical protein
VRGRRQLGALALGLCGVAVAVGSGADFTARSANPSNTFSAGSLSIDNSREGAAILSASNMKPGGAPHTGTVDIQNTGSIPGDFALSRNQLTSTDVGGDSGVPFSSRVLITVKDCGPWFDGHAPACGYGSNEVMLVQHRSLTDMSDPVPVGRFQPGEHHRFEFSAALDASADNVFGGDSSSVQFVWTAVQTPEA